MHHLEIDWLLLAARVPAWRTLAPAARRQLLTADMAQTMKVSALGGGAQQVIASGFAIPFNDTRVALDSSQRPLIRALRAMHRHRILDQHDDASCARYLQDNFTAAERQALATTFASWSRVHDTMIARHVTSVAWVEAALAGTATSGPFRSGWLNDAAQEHVRALLRAVLDAGGSVPIADLPQLSSVPRAHRAAAVTAALRHALLFATLRAPDDEPLLTIWPGTLQRLRQPKPELPAAMPAPAEMFRFPVLVEDAATILVAASAEPLRLRGHDGVLFERATRRLEEALTPLPEWAGRICGGWSSSVRINAAVRFLLGGRLLRHGGTAGSDLRLEPTAAARAWLGASAAARHRLFLDFVRGDADRPSDAGGDAFDYEDYDYDDLTTLGLPPLHYVAVSVDEIRGAIADAFAAVAPGEFVDVGKFLDFHARSDRNPLLRARTYGYRGDTLETRQQAWIDTLGSIILNRLVPLAGVAYGIAANSRFLFTMTPAGRYMLGIDADVALEETADAPGGIIVQADYDVVFLSPAPASEAAIGRFAERTTAGSVGRLFRITPAAVQNATAAGLDADAILGTLRQYSCQPVPDNVAREIAGWAAACRRVTTGSAFLLRCPDEATAAHVLAAAGARARLLAPAIVELLDPRAKTAIARKLRAKGIFLD